MSQVRNVRRPRARVRGDMSPPPGSRVVGQFHGKLVFEERRPNLVQVVERGSDGEILYHTTKDGRKIRPITKLVREGWEFREFILEDLGNGMVKKNPNFRPDPEDEERRALLDLNRPEALARRIEELEDLVARMTATDAQEDDQETAEALQAPEGSPDTDEGPVSAQAAREALSPDPVFHDPLEG